MAEVFQSFINKLHFSISKGLPHAEPVFTLRTNEHELVQGVLQMLQGFPSSLFYWDEDIHSFHMKDGIHVSHLSQTSMNCILIQFIYSGTCLKQVEYFVKKVEASRLGAPTLKAFANSVYSWLKRLRAIALSEEVKSAGSDTGTTTTLLGLTNSLSSFCSGAELLAHVVYGAIPSSYFESETPSPAGEMATHILNHLFKKLNEICLVQGGEEEPSHMLLAIFTGSLLPYLEVLDTWLYDGILDDPYEEMYFYANGAISIDQPAFWDRSYLLRPGKRSISGAALPPSDGESTAQVKRESGDPASISLSSSLRERDQNDMDIIACPVFLKDIARTIVSAGKSLQLVQYIQDEYLPSFNRTNDNSSDFLDANLFASSYRSTNRRLNVDFRPESLTSSEFEDARIRCGYLNEESIVHHINHGRVMGALTLSEVFLVSLTGLIGDDSHIYENFRMHSHEIAQIHKSCTDKKELVTDIGGAQSSKDCKNIWCKFLDDAVSERRNVVIAKGVFSERTIRDSNPIDMKVMQDVTVHHDRLKCQDSRNVDILRTSLVSSFCPENPVITVCTELLRKNTAAWDDINISRNFHLPPLNDESLREAIFGYTNSSTRTDLVNEKHVPRVNGTDYTFGFQFVELGQHRLEDDAKKLETLYPFPTILPCFQEALPMSELLPFQKNSTLASRILNWIQSIKLKDTPQPAVLMEECLAFYIKKQVDHVGKHILLKLVSEWKLMDALCVLRAVYLLGSGDLLQQFLIVIFDKLDKGRSWDDDFELNTILQESIRNSADGTLLSAPDSLVVSITTQGPDDEACANDNISTPRIVRNQFLGIDALDLLKFTYKISWPLDLIANVEALKKYNQVMCFLLKVKRAKYVLDEARRWMWKGRGGTAQSYKRHLLVEQKLLHFVDAFHQYVMDRVFHSAWTELCSGMASAGSLDEVIQVHENYLLSIQRQCFVAPDKLWALIASRIKTILVLALDFASVQRTLSTGGAAPAIKARCDMEVKRIEKQFDDCIAFLLRILSFKLNVGHFPHLTDLVTRINYNYFYMSSTGNLLTIPTFQSTTLAKPAKPYNIDSRAN